MRSLFASVTLSCLSAFALFAAAPPAKVPAEWLKLIDQLGDDDTRATAEKKLEAIGEDALPALHRAGKSHDDVDVRLRATVIAAAIEKKLYGEIRQFKGHAEGIMAFAVSPDGTRLASASWDKGSETAARV